MIWSPIAQLAAALTSQNTTGQRVLLRSKPGSDPLARYSAFSRMDPQPHNYFLFLATLSSHHSYEGGFEEVHGVRQSTGYLSSFEDATATSSVTATC